MKPARFSEEQIISILREAGAGAKVTQLCWREKISDATFYKWPSKYERLEVSKTRGLGHLEEANLGRKAIVAEQALDFRAPKDVLSKNGYGPGEARDGGTAHGGASGVAASCLLVDRNRLRSGRQRRMLRSRKRCDSLL